MYIIEKYIPIPRIKKNSTTNSIGNNNTYLLNETPAANNIIKNSVDSKRNEIAFDNAIDNGIIILGILTLFNIPLFSTNDFVTHLTPLSKNLKGIKPAKKNNTQS